MKEIVDAFFKTESIVNHQIESYNYFVATKENTNNIMQQIVDETKVSDDEERNEDEVLNIGSIRVANSGSRSKNPAFDVTPSRYVTAFITEYGIFDPSSLKSLKSKMDADLFMR